MIRGSNNFSHASNKGYFHYIECKEIITSSSGGGGKELKSNIMKNSSLLPNRTALFQTHLLRRTIYGLMWNFGEF